MKRDFKSMIAGVIAVCMCITMAGCGDSKPKNEEELESMLENMPEDEMEKRMEEAAESMDSASWGAVEVATTEEPTIKEVDPFESLDVAFEGISPAVKLNMNTPYGSKVKYTANAEKGLKNGDVVEITAEPTSQDDSIVYTETVKQYTVENMPSYVCTMDDIPQETYDKMDTTFRDGYAAYLANNGAQPVIKEMELVGNYLLTPKDTTAYNAPFNYIYFVYKINADFNKTGENHDYYWCAYYSEVYALEDGTMVVDYNDLHMGSHIFDNLLVDAFLIEGCNDVDTIFQKNVVPHIDQYEYISTIEE